MGRLTYNFINRVNGHDAVTCIVYQMPGTNATETISNIETLLEETQLTMPPGMKVNISMHLSQLRPSAVLEALPLTKYDWAVLLFGTIVIFVASVIQERSQRTIREMLDEKCLALRWVVLLGGIFAVVLMGVYGPGVQASEFVYMQF